MQAKPTHDIMQKSHRTERPDYRNTLDRIFNDISHQPLQGHAADYIPELAKVNPSQFGISLCHASGEVYNVGDAQTKFSIQSIVKVFSLALAYRLKGEALWQRLGVEPSGGAFNSLALLEFEQGIPRNPFINAGALVIADILVSHWVNPKYTLLAFVRQLASTPNIDFNLSVAASEAAHGHRNAALVQLMKSFGNIHNDPRDVLDVYFHICSIEMTCQELAQAFLVFAHGGQHPITEETILSLSQTKRMNALMQTCGFYDESGDYSFRVGLPGKSGVGGGVAAVHPGHYSVAVWSPPLNAKGNSARGIAALEQLTTQTGVSIF